MAILLAFLLLFSGCCGKGRPTSPHERQLSLSISTELRSLDPGMGIDNVSQFIIKMLFDGLMAYDPQGNLIPSLANHIDISKDQRTYTFHLRDAFWSNGDAITADDFVFAWKRIIDEKTRALASPQFFAIKNVEAILRGEKAIEEMGVVAKESKILEVVLEHPSPYFLEMVANTPFFPVPARIVQKDKEWLNSGRVVSNGPFTLKLHRANNELLLEKSSTFWDAEHVHLPGIHIAIIHEDSTQLALFEKGEIDFLGRPFSRIPLDAMPSLMGQGKVQIAPCNGVNWFFLNTESFPFNNVKMRKAFAYAINRKELTEHLLPDGEQPACAILHPHFQVHSENYFPDNLVVHGQELFEEALSEMGITRQQLAPITLSHPMSPLHRRVAQAIQQMWQDAFRIPISLESQEWKVFYQKIASGSYQIGSMGWVSWLHDPIYMMMTFKFRGGVNMSRWENSLYRQLLDATELEEDPTKRRELFHAAQTLLLDEMPVIPLFFMSISYMKNPDLKDVYISELNQIDFRFAHFEK